MKHLYLSIALVFAAIIGQAQSLVAYNPQGTFFDWWSGDFQIPEVGTGTIDSCHIEIDIDGAIAHLKYHYWLRSILKKVKKRRIMLKNGRILNRQSHN
jgi:hypothetical protein